MASGKFDVRPESLSSAAQRFARSSDELARAIQTLQAKTLGAGSPWGHDELGSIFAEAYVECSSLGLQAMAHLADQLGGIAEGLQAMSQNLTATDQAGQSTFDQAASGL
jgi:uncharacterized protein YukE